MKIMALDLGKCNTVFCDYDSINGEHAFGTVKTTPQQIHDLLVEKEPDRVVMEVCSIAGWIVDITEALGKETEVANPMHDAWRWKNVKKKTDRDDALKLARLSAMNQLPTVHMPKKAVREKRALVKHRQRLVKYRTSLKNAIRAIFTREGIPMMRGQMMWSRKAHLRHHEIVFPFAKGTYGSASGSWHYVWFSGPGVHRGSWFAL